MHFSNFVCRCIQLWVCMWARVANFSCIFVVAGSPIPIHRKLEVVIGTSLVKLLLMICFICAIVMPMQDHVFFIERYCLLYQKINFVDNALLSANAWNLEKEKTIDREFLLFTMQFCNRVWDMWKTVILCWFHC